MNKQELQTLTIEINKLQPKLPVFTCNYDESFGVAAIHIVVNVDKVYPFNISRNGRWISLLVMQDEISSSYGHAWAMTNNMQFIVNHCGDAYNKDYQWVANYVTNLLHELEKLALDNKK